MLEAVGSFFKGLGIRNTALLVLGITIIAIIVILMIRVNVQRQTIDDLEDKIERYREAGDAEIPTFVSPWDGIDFTPSTPTETPTESTYDKVIAEFRAQLEGAEDEEVFTDHGDVDARDRVVGEHTSALRAAIQRKIAAERSGS
ncbi:MAG: hypothetical protein LC687_04890 [Actinobacteria bacterium]|nr:hypothetical protein [Actinomycetota bacterium]